MWSGEATADDGTAVARWLFSDRGAFGASPFSELNVADHVGDDPAAVLEHRRLLLARLGRELDDAVWPEFCHSADLAWAEPGKRPGAVDALITDVPGLVLTAQGADCVPLLAVEPVRRVVLSAHIGWRGAAAGIVDHLLGKLRRHDGAPERLQVWLGPAICGGCYQVPAERLEQVAAVLPAAARPGGLDLREGLAQRLESEGAAVSIVAPCTFETDSLFSYRRDGQTGRQVGMVVLL